jgi:hypothetical protein
MYRASLDENRIMSWTFSDAFSVIELIRTRCKSRDIADAVQTRMIVGRPDSSQRKCDQEPDEQSCHARQTPGLR